MLNTSVDSLYKDLIPQGFIFADNLCGGGYPDSDACGWYHGSWMLLRSLGVTSNPFWHKDFFESALQKTNAISKKVLVVGTADFSTPFLCSEFGITNLEVTDKCQTPIEICKLVSEKLSLNWSCHIEDITQPLQRTTDIVVNDAFLSRFTNKVIPLTGIAKILKHGGYYITTIKKGDSNNDGGKIDESLKKKFIDKVIERYNTSLDLNRSLNIKKIAETYIENMASYPIASEEEMLDLFQNCGFKICMIDSYDVEGEYEQTTYFQVIAQRCME